VSVTKTTVISVRVPPDIKAALTAAAQAERRSLATMVEVMVLDYCRTRSIPLPAVDDATSQATPSRKTSNRSSKT
jgi:hypothetical protein